MKKQLVILIFIMGITCFAVEIEEKKYDIKDKYTIISGNIPLFKLEEGDLNRAVDIFESLADIIVMESKRYFLEEKKKNSNSFILKSDYREYKNQMNVKSYLVKTFYYIGGNHGMMIETPYNFRNGKEVTLKDFFKDDVNYSVLIKNKIEEAIIEDNPSFYYEDVAIKDKEYKFYFSEDKLVINFDVYEIGPYESGIFSFEIPISELSDYLK